MSKTVYIYGLYEPETDELRYIGKARSIRTRLLAHFSLAKNGDASLKSNWIRELLARGLEPTIRTLEETDTENWPEAETRWIESAIQQGSSLLNVLSGGDQPPSWAGRKQSPEHIQRRVEVRKARGNYAHSEEAKRKVSLAKAGTQTGEDNHFFGRTHSKDSIEKMRQSHRGHPAWNKGIPMSPESKAKVSRAKKGRKMPEAERLAMSQRMKGRKMSPEFCEKIRLANLGKQHSETTKQKLREANLGKHHSEETKEKLRLAFTGRYVSEETRRKLSIAKKGKPLTEEQRQTRRAVQEKLWADPEYRAKMLEAQRRRRARERLEKKGENR